MGLAASGDTALVGRDDEAARLRRLLGLTGATPDAQRLVLLSGDAGIGKTRLVAEVVATARSGGWTVLVGHCLGEAGRALPYLPFTEMFGRLAGQQPEVVERLVEAHPSIAGMLPSQRRPSASAGREDPVDRSDLLEATHAALEDLAADGPVLAVVEDVHWADESSRDLLTLLFTRGFARPVAVVATYRSDDLHRRHPLRATLAHWSRLGDVRRVDLEPLADDAVRAIVTGQQDGLSERQVRDVVARAEGNAFFAEELVAASAIGRSAIAEDLSRLLLVRFDALDAAVQRVVRLAAVAGRQVPHGLLAAVAELTPTALDETLRDAVERNILVPTESGGYAFRHALLAEAVYDDLLPGERVRAHERYAATLTNSMALGTWADLARHAEAAGDRVTALSASLQAGDAALAVGGPQEAWHQFQRAVALAGDDAPEADVAVLKAAQAAALTGRSTKAVELIQDRLARRGQAADLGRAELLAALATAARTTELDVDTLAATREAVGLVGEVGTVPADVRARVLASHVQALTDFHRDDEAALAAAEAVHAAEASGLDGVADEVRVIVTRGVERSGDAQASQVALEQIIETVTAEASPARVRALHHLGSLHHRMGRLEAAVRAYRQGYDAAVRAGNMWGPYALDSRLLAGIAAYEAGLWDEAVALLQHARELAPQPGGALLTAAGLYVAAGRGDASGLTRLAEVRPWWGDDGILAVVAGTAAVDLRGNTGDLGGVLSAHDELVDFLSRIWSADFQARVRLVALVLGQLAGHVQRLPSAERSEHVARGEKLAADAEWVYERRLQGGDNGPEAVAWLARVRAEALRLQWLGGQAVDHDALVRQWREAVASFTAYGHPYEIARSQARLGGVLLAAGDASATDVLAEARATAERLGARPLLAELDAVGADGHGTPARDTQRRAETLTPREREILDQLALGRSNGQIGSALFISTKTASVHVSNILAKLGATNRGEAVAVARERGLLD